MMRGITNITATAIIFITFLCRGMYAFTSPSKTFITHLKTTNLSPFNTQGTIYIEQQKPKALQRDRRSMSSVATMSLFGLGAPELAIILIAGAFILGPEKLAELGKDAGKIAGELKEVPKEFQEGLKEGEKQAKDMKKQLIADDKEPKAEDSKSEENIL